MPDLSQIRDAGPFAVFVFSVFVASVTLWRKVWVPGWIYLESEDKRKVAETQAERNAEALEVQAKAYAELSAIYRELSRDYAQLSRRVRD